MDKLVIGRRRFLQGAAATLALLGAGDAAFAESEKEYGERFIGASDKKYRVGSIGTGWHGKSELFRLIQVAPVEVVALCDVDKNMPTAAGALVSQRQLSRKTPLLYSDYR